MAEAHCRDAEGDFKDLFIQENENFCLEQVGRNVGRQGYPGWGMLLPCCRHSKVTCFGLQ